MISLTVTALVFGVVFLAELPDKTALAGLGTRYRASYDFAGVVAAFLLHVVLAVAAGSVPHSRTPCNAPNSSLVTSHVWGI